MDFNILIDEKIINNRVRELAKSIDIYYSNSNLVMVSVLKGSFMFFSDLVKNMELFPEIDFIAFKSYEENRSVGVVSKYLNLSIDIEGKDVLIVEDIVDSGKTIIEILKYIKDFNPKSIKVITLLNKPSNHKISKQIDWIGFNIKDKFIFGYGLDYNHKYRNIKDIVIANE